ncbi:hypothetical protein BRX43_00335 [Sphingomonas sp. S-NIH.Pt15_0812]|nr:hypothetical protein BRX43_00335 [Sphingomonas sp. S-NIH.Pt15_0812]
MIAQYPDLLPGAATEATLVALMQRDGGIGFVERGDELGAGRLMPPIAIDGARQQQLGLQIFPVAKQRLGRSDGDLRIPAHRTLACLALPERLGQAFALNHDGGRLDLSEQQQQDHRPISMQRSVKRNGIISLYGFRRDGTSSDRW